jgi:hypothetical protein
MVHRARFWVGRLLPILVFCTASACTGSIGDASGGSDSTGSGGPGSTTGGSTTPGVNWQPLTPCDPVLRTRVSRLSDRHFANAIRDLLGLSATPTLQTSSSSTELFLLNKPAPVNGSVALSIRDLVEKVSSEATATGKPAIQCTGDETTCAGQFIDRFASRAFRRPVTAAERTNLLTVYTSGRDNYGAHAGGIRLVIEAVLQAPSFIYLSELGEATAERRDLTAYELAAKISMFLRDSLPDDELWLAAQQGKLSTADQIAGQVSRLLATAEVKTNITKIYTRLFDLDRLASVSKAPEVTDFTAALAASMGEGTRRFIEATLWSRGGTFSQLMTSRDAFADSGLAKIYGVAAPSASGFGAVAVPATERAGILTDPSLMTMHALPNESSVVHRGVFIMRQMLCFQPPPPQASFLQQGEAIKLAEPTERGRSDKRRAMSPCSSCHGIFDPFGIAFENYDTLGRYRTTIATPTGNVPVDASWDFDLYDIKGKMNNAVELAQRLSESAAVRECMSRQLASYAFGERLSEAEACTVADISQQFAQSGGNLIDLIGKVAAWPGLRTRTTGGAL